MQRIMSKRLAAVTAMVAMVLTIAVPTFAQVLPQSDPEVTNPAAGEQGVPSQEDVTSTEPSSSTEEGALPTTTNTTTTDATNDDPAAPAGDSETDVIPVKLSSELCADVTDPLVVGTFEQVLPEVVQGCQQRPPIPAGTAPVDPAPAEEPAPVEPAPVEPAPIETTPPNQATSVYP